MADPGSAGGSRTPAADGEDTQASALKWACSSPGDSLALALVGEPAEEVARVRFGAERFGHVVRVVVDHLASVTASVGAVPLPNPCAFRVDVVQVHHRPARGTTVPWSRAASVKACTIRVSES